MVPTLISHADTSSSAWTAYYYNNTNMSGNAVASKQLGTSNGPLDEAVGTGSPASGVNSDYYSAKYVSYRSLNPGDYIVRTQSDDGVRVLVDGQVVLDKWGPSDGQKNAAEFTISGTSSSYHWIEVQYEELTGDSYVHASVTPLNDEIDGNGWLGVYQSGSTTSVVGGKSQPVKIGQADFNWGDGSPAQGISSDHFNASFYKEFAGNQDYFVQTFADDGVRVKLDDQKTIVDRYSDSAGQFASGIITGLSSADHKIETDYYDNTGQAVLYSDIVPFGKWEGYYYNNENVSGSPVYSKTLSQSDGSLKEDNGLNSPGPGVPNDHFSARYFTANHFKAGSYIIRTQSDDGVRVLVDGKIVLDKWGPSDNGKNAIEINLKDLAGSNPDVHWIEVQYQEQTGNSDVNVSITPLNDEIDGNGWLGVYQSGTSSSVVGGKSEPVKLGQADFNWGNGSPSTGISNDHFNASFYKEFAGNQDYFVQTFADDGVRVKLDDQNTVVDRYSDSAGQFTSGIITGLSSADHKIETDYYDNTGQAVLFSDIIPFGKWEGYYYNNMDMSGNPVYAQTLGDSNGNLSEDIGSGSPGPGVSNDHFSARYFSARHLSAGSYVIRVRADDGVKLLVDGKEVFSHWNVSGGEEYSVRVNIQDNKSSSNPDVHTFEVQYYENDGNSGLDVSITPYQNEIPSDGWIGTFYNNDQLQGDNPIVIGGNSSTNKINDLNFDWGQGSPGYGINSDNFSGVFERSINLMDANYEFDVKADTGFRLYVDGNLEVDQWSYVNKTIQKTLFLTKGTHQIKVEFREVSGSASLKYQMKMVNTFETTSYNFTLNDIVNKEMKTTPLTDSYGPYAYVSNQYITLNGTKSGTVNLSSGYLNVRDAPNGNAVGQLSNGDAVTIVGQDPSTGWYKILYTWKYAQSSDVQYYLDPNNFSYGTDDYFQFLVLSRSAGLDVQEVNNKILTSDKGILAGKAQSFIDAGQEFGINEIYLISHALLETGNGKSKLATGYYTVNGKQVYNMYGINATDNCPGGADQCAAQYAYNQGWFTPEEAIIGGAKFVAQNYINNGQDTLYKMRWNPDAIQTLGYASHQYASDIAWADKQVTSIKELYDLLSNYVLIFDTPTYQ